MEGCLQALTDKKIKGLLCTCSVWPVAPVSKGTWVNDHNSPTTHAGEDVQTENPVNKNDQSYLFGSKNQSEHNYNSVQYNYTIVLTRKWKESFYAFPSFLSAEGRRGLHRQRWENAENMRQIEREMQSFLKIGWVYWAMNHSWWCCDIHDRSDSIERLFRTNKGIPAVLGSCLFYFAIMLSPIFICPDQATYFSFHEHTESVCHESSHVVKVQDRAHIL